jgi:GT2 family glycosyltransferase
MKKLKKLKNKVRKILYLGESFFISIKQEGFASAFNRFYHFILFGKGVTSEKDYKVYTEKLRSEPLPLDDVLELITARQGNEYLYDTKEKIDIIIPIYNGFDYIRPLFESIFKNTKIPYRLIVINDASPDGRVASVSKELKADSSDEEFLFIENKENLGFVKTINKAVSFVENNFVILNTDTEVPEGWLERLMRPIYDSKKIASTTPFTNSGTIFSFPNFLEDNLIFENLIVDEIDKYFRKIKVEKNIVVPTGMGFCMGFNKSVVDEIGMFDEETFIKGYGEENDWSQRAQKAGYENIIVPNLFVYHKHGGSFSGNEKDQLIRENILKLNKKHPGYDLQVQNFIKKDSLRKIREFLILLITADSSKSTLIVDHELGGGANIYRKKVIEDKVKNGESVFLLSYSTRDKNYYLKYFYKNYKISYKTSDLESVFNFVESFPMKEMIINQLVSFENPLNILTRIKKIKIKNKSKVIFLLHDYFCVCPSYNLLNDKQKYCYVPKMERCRKCLNKNKGEFTRYVKTRNIDKWRKEWLIFLESSDEIVCFSNASMEILFKVFPSIRKKTKLVPHKVDYIKKESFVQNKIGTLNIGILGGISFAKGSNIVSDMVKIIEMNDDNIKVVIIGPFPGKIKSKKLVVTGKYKHDEIERLAKNNQIDVFLIPSIWPETFSYTSEEIMKMGYPLAVFDIGAPAERVEKYDKGIIISEISADAVLAAIKRRFGKKVN